ncbi:unnamed protein product (macronuclear) [Paramecium tetraurelia]|uniref:Uncharacterized protein n=1 Tax=Paramecium tetraurelia TaxID=5888 RepID=A0DER9_PARTE|nr:uncharacterized protein GSPATT00016362001 [Paramecium tetraurelia]CAK81536.1 unnamed protein product [Paramecium tetraurelia]|eukprot:XP_001448933.1 hypothetical protein (macronuclear) [Paramecium tetraurelia strain d4-2]
MNRQEKSEIVSGLRAILEEVSKPYQTKMLNFKNEKCLRIEYYSCNDLIQRITKAFREIMNSNQEYKKLESVLQQQEADIRNHISLEQQMKLYQDQLQSKLDEASQEIKRLQSEISRYSTNIVQQWLSESQKRKEKSQEASLTQRNASPKNKESLSQHGYSSHRSSCDELFKRYNKLLQQQQAQISQRSNNIQISQYMMKGRQTLAEICNIQSSKPSRSQTKHSSSAKKGSQNNSISSETIRNLLKVK